MEKSFFEVAQFKTSNLNEAAYLMALGHKIKEWKKLRNRMYWTFSDVNTDFKLLIRNYEENTTKVHPKRFVEYQNELKDMVFTSEGT